jgi:hypothetical protein
MAVAFESAREFFLGFPGVEEGTAYGTPAFRVRRQFMARLREDGETLVLKVGEVEQGLFMALDPAVYYLTDHYKGTSLVLIRLAIITPDELQLRIAESWRKLASKRDLAAYDSRSNQP